MNPSFHAYFSVSKKRLCVVLVGALQVIGHQIYPINVLVHLVDIEPPKIPIRRWRGDYTSLAYCRLELQWNNLTR